MTNDSTFHGRYRDPGTLDARVEHDIRPGGTREDEARWVVERAAADSDVIYSPKPKRRRFDKRGQPSDLYDYTVVLCRR